MAQGIFCWRGLLPQSPTSSAGCCTPITCSNPYLPLYRPRNLSSLVQEHVRVVLLRSWRVLGLFCQLSEISNSLRPVFPLEAALARVLRPRHDLGVLAWVWDLLGPLDDLVDVFPRPVLFVFQVFEGGTLHSEGNHWIRLRRDIVAFDSKLRVRGLTVKLSQRSQIHS